MGDARRRSLRTWLFMLLLVALTLGVYVQVIGFEFVHDDDVYVTAVPAVRAGLTMEGVRWAFGATHAEFWHPLTWLSLMLDRELFGPGAAGFHLSALLLHLANTLLLFHLTSLLTGARLPGFIAAALFAVHPLHVQTAGWIADRKDLLSALFCILLLRIYRAYAARPSRGRYLLALLVFALGLMAKPNLVALPVLLLVADWWPLGRLRRGEGGSSLARLAVEKIPFLLLALFAGTIAYWAQAIAGGVAPLAAISIRARLTNALVSYVDYVRLTIWPSGLAAFYPHPLESIPLGKAFQALSLLVAVSTLLWLVRRRRPHLTTGWIWFVAMLLPAIGIVQVGNQAMADRYTYVAHIGLFLGLSWEAFVLGGGSPFLTRALGSAVLMTLVLYSASSWREVGYYRNSLLLFRRALEVTADNWFVRVNLGISLMKGASFREAEQHFRAIVKMNPFNPIGHYQLALALGYQDSLAEAEKHAREAVRLDPRDVQAINALVWILTKSPRGNLGEAEQLCRSAIALAPGYIDPYINLAAILARSGRLGEAKIELEKAIRVDPESQTARDNLSRLGVAR